MSQPETSISPTLQQKLPGLFEEHDSQPPGFGSHLRAQYNSFRHFSSGEPIRWPKPALLSNIEQTMAELRATQRVMDGLLRRSLGNQKGHPTASSSAHEEYQMRLDKLTELRATAEEQVLMIAAMAELKWLLANQPPGTQPLALQTRTSALLDDMYLSTLQEVISQPTLIEGYAHHAITALDKLDQAIAHLQEMMEKKGAFYGAGDERSRKQAEYTHNTCVEGLMPHLHEQLVSLKAMVGTFKADYIMGDKELSHRGNRLYIKGMEAGSVPSERLRDAIAHEGVLDLRPLIRDRDKKR